MFRLFILFFLLNILLSVFSSGGPLTSTGGYVNLEDGGVLSGKTIKIDEESIIPVKWYIQGLLRINSGESYKGLPSNPFVDGSWGDIGYKIIAQWKNESLEIEKGVLISGTFAENNVYKQFNTSMNAIGFTVNLGELSTALKLPSLECRDVSKSSYEFYAVISAPFQGISDGEIKSNTRKIIINDRVDLDIQCPQLEISKTGTSGDPLPFSNLNVKVYDTNPNQNISKFSADFGGVLIKGISRDPKRDYSFSGGVIDAKFRFEQEFSVPVPSDARMPEDNQPLIVVISVAGEAPSHPDGGEIEIIKEFEIINSDNDAPEFELEIIGDGVTEKIEIIEGVRDELSDSGNLKIIINGKSFTIKDPWWNYSGVLKLSEISSIPSSDWINVIEDTRMLAKFSARDNWGIINKCIVNDSEVNENDEFPIFFRKGGFVEYQVIIEDSANNIREVHIPVNVVETRLSRDSLK